MIIAQKDSKIEELSEKIIDQETLQRELENASVAMHELREHSAEDKVRIQKQVQELKISYETDH